MAAICSMICNLFRRLPNMGIDASRPSVLYGRDTDIDKLREFVGKSRVILLLGGSGIGKTSVVETVRYLASRSATEDFVTSYFEVDSSYTEPLSLAGKICEDLLPAFTKKTATTKKFRKALNENSSENTASLATAFLLDGVKWLAPGLEKTAEQLAKIIKENYQAVDVRSIAQKIIRQNRENHIEQFKSLLSLSSEIGISGLVVVDSFERSSSDFRAALDGMIAKLPRTWTVIASFNDETINREEVALIVNSADFQSRNSSKNHKLNPLKPEHIEKWTTVVTKVAPTIEELSKIEVVTQGRPFFIEQYFLKSNIERPMDSDYYTRLSEDTSVSAMKILRALSMLPGFGWVSWEFLRAIAEPTTPADLEADLKSLSNKLLIQRDRNGKKSKIYHELISTVMRERIPDELKIETALSIKGSLGHSEVINSFSNKEIDSILLEIFSWAPSREVDEITRLTGIVDDLISRGSLESGFRAIGSMRKGLISLGGMEKQISKLDYLNVLALYNRGNFREALESLRNLGNEKVDNECLDIELLSAKISLRLGLFDAAAASIQHVINSKGASLEHTIGALRCANTIARDKGLYNDALRTLGEILSEAGPLENLDARLQCDVLRTKARTACYLDDQLDQGLEAANSAITIAQDNGLNRELGNSYLALAEVQRHFDRNDQAKISYEKAIEIGRDCADKDSIFWSHLGLSDSNLLLKDFSEARRILNEVSWMVNFWGEQRPFEEAHFELSQQVLEYLENMNEAPRVPEFYSAHGIIWPENYLHDLIRRPNSPAPKSF